MYAEVCGIDDVRCNRSLYSVLYNVMQAVDCCLLTLGSSNGYYASVHGAYSSLFVHHD